MGEKRDFDDLPLKNGDFLYRTVSLPEGSEKMMLNLHLVLQAWLYCNCNQLKVGNQGYEWRKTIWFHQTWLGNTLYINPYKYTLNGGSSSTPCD